MTGSGGQRLYLWFNLNFQLHVKEVRHCHKPTGSCALDVDPTINKIILEL